VGHQIIKQPNGAYAVFSSYNDTWLLADATREDLVEYYVKKAADEARRNVERTIDLVDSNPRKAYFQFTMTFEEANAKSIVNGGWDLTT
jgi:hypothetical protein